MLISVMILSVSSSWATAFSTDIIIQGSVIYDNGFAFSAGNVTQSGEVQLTGGTVPTSTPYTGPPPIPPLNGALTDIGDGLGVTGTVDSDFDSEFAIGVDMEFDMTNNSVTDSYKVTFEVDLTRNFVDAFGTDAFADSEFTVDDPGGEVFFSDLISDTFFGDKIAGAPTGTFGDPLSESDLFSFDVIIAPGLNLFVSSDWTLDGGAFDPGSGVDVDFEAFIRVSNVMNLSSPPPPNTIPEPGTMVLFGFGLTGLAAACRRRT